MSRVYHNNIFNNIIIYGVALYNTHTYIGVAVRRGMYGNNAPDAFPGNVWSRLLLLSSSQSSSSHSDEYNCERRIKYLHEQFMRRLWLGEIYI